MSANRHRAPLERHLAPLAALAVLAAAACDGPTTPMRPDDGRPPPAWPPSLALIDAPPAVCGEPTEVGLMPGPDVRSGSVEVTNDETNIYLTFRTETDQPIVATAAFVGDAPDAIPTLPSGLPRLLQFPYRSSHAWGTTEVVWAIPRSDVSTDEAVIAAFAQVGLLASWGEGETISPKKDWAMYFTHTLTGCTAETVGPDGGTVSTPDGAVTISIPAGALDAPVDITIEPATAGEIPDAHRVTPIGGGIFDFGPDGLEFLSRATVVFHYDESDLPDGVPEQELGAFVINGIFERLPSTVDTEANTVTAEIDHFSIFFSGYQPPPTVDLELTRLSSPTLDPQIGHPMDFVAEVRNNGPDASTGGRVVYEAGGPVELGELSASCEADAEVGDFAVSCALPDLDPGAETAVGTFQIVPQVPGETVSVTATVFPRSGVLDEDPANHVQQVALSVGVAAVDLKVDVALSPESHLVVGGLAEFRATVFNVGAAFSSGGVFRYEIYSDVAAPDPLMDVGPCTEVTDPAPATAAVECDLPSLDTDEFVERTIGITPVAEGSIAVRGMVTAAEGDVEENLEDNDRTVGVTVAAEPHVDLEPVDLTVSGARGVGATVTFQAAVFNWGPAQSRGGTVTYAATGPVELGPVDPACVQIGVTVSCPFPTMTSESTGPVGSYSVVVLGSGNVTFSATVRAVEGDVDQNPENDTKETTIVVGVPNQADLEIASVELPGEEEAVVDTPMDFVVKIRNLGPDASQGGIVRFSAGDVELGDVGEGCTGDDTTVPDGAVISCDLPPLAVDGTHSQTFQVIARSAGDVQVSVVLFPGVGDEDPNRSNGLYDATVSVTAGVGG